MATPLPVISERVRGCATPLAEPDLDPQQATRLAALVKALADPTRLRIVDALRNAAPEAVCQCELLPLFAMSQPALAKHLRLLVGAGIIDTQRRGLWTYYFLAEHGMDELSEWLA